MKIVLSLLFLAANVIAAPAFGVESPLVGYGTYPLQKKACTQAVEEALSAGYQVIDTATFYNNFPAIGEAIKGKNRQNLYLQSKVWHDQLLPHQIRNDLHRTLALLQIDTLDAYFIHWPNSQVPIEASLGAMEELRNENKIRHIGLSNVSVNHVKKALEVGVPITWVQVEMSPNFCDFALLEFCQEHGIQVQAWRPLGLGSLSTDSLLRRIGKKRGKTASQVALRWIIQHGCLPLPHSKNPTHIQENIALSDFALTDEEMQRIDERARKGERLRLKDRRMLGFADEFDFSYEECWPEAIQGIAKASQA